VGAGAGTVGTVGAVGVGTVGAVGTGGAQPGGASLIGAKKTL
jgi:hypothetical protein